MTCNQDADATSVAFKSRRSASAGPDSKKIYHPRNGVFSSDVAPITDFRARNAVRRWLLVAIHRAARETDKARSLRQSREVSICEARLTGLHSFALALGPMEPETLALLPEWRAQ